MTDELKEAGSRGELDGRSEKLGYKIREAQMQKVPYMVIVGEKEVAENVVSVRKRDEGDIGSMELKAFADKVLEDK